MQRLGAGPPGSAFSMQSLRSHHFFASINWKTLWADPAPPLESGLVKREHPLMGQDQNWDDVGAAWDDIAEADDDYDGEGDGIRWADDAEGPAYIVRHGYQEGHMGELQTYGKKMASEEEQAEEDADTVMGHESPASLTVTAVGEPEPIDVPAETGSGTSSSSDGSPIEKLGAALEAMRMARGRTRAQTPIQGNGPSPDIDWWAFSFLSRADLIHHRSIDPGRRYSYRTRKSCSTPKSKRVVSADARADSFLSLSPH